MAAFAFAGYVVGGGDGYPHESLRDAKLSYRGKQKIALPCRSGGCSCDE